MLHLRIMPWNETKVHRFSQYILEDFFVIGLVVQDPRAIVTIAAVVVVVQQV